MKKTFIHNILLPGIRLVLTITFLYATFSKGMDYPEFILQIRKSPLLEPFPPQLIGISVLAVETGIALLLSFPRTVLAGLYGSFFLMLLFSVYVTVLYFGYPNAPCSCGGILGRMSYPVHIGFNVFMTGAALCGILFYKRTNGESGMDS